MKFYVGDKVKVVNPCAGCFDAKNRVGKVTENGATNGLMPSDKIAKINVEVTRGEVWCVNEDGCQLIERSIPTKESLVGKIIVTRNLNEYLVLKTHSGSIFGININDGGFYIGLNTFDHELHCDTDNEFDIMSVHEIDNVATFNSLYKVKKKTIWERPAEKVKEMTMADIEALVGCKVKIVKE